MAFAQRTVRTSTRKLYQDARHFVETFCANNLPSHRSFRSAAKNARQILRLAQQGVRRGDFLAQPGDDEPFPAAVAEWSPLKDMVAAPEVELSITVPLPSDHLQATDSHEMEDNGMPEAVVVAA